MVKNGFFVVVKMVSAQLLCAVVLLLILFLTSTETL